MEEVSEITKGKTKTQWLAAAVVFLFMVMMGATFAWISPFLGKLNRPNPPFAVTKEQISWVASISSISRVIGIIIGSIKNHYFGSKTSLYMCGFYYVVAWVSLICANSINIVYINQLFCGIGIGGFFLIYPLYLGEIANPEIRGTLISFVMNGFMVGILYGNLMGSLVSPWIYGVVNLVLSGIYLVTFYFLPSTPHYFINCNKLGEARKALSYYKDGADKEEEFTKLQEFIKSSKRVSILESVRKLRNPVNFKTFLMINILYSLTQFSGIYPIIEYMEVIIMNGKIEIILPATLVTIMSASTIPAGFVAVVIGDKFGRVTMLFTSCVIFCVAFLTWGLSFHLLELGFSPSVTQWLVVASALVYRINMSIGLSPVVPVLISEVFAPNVKSVSACLCNIISSLCIFLAVKNFQAMADNMTYKMLFYFFAGLILAVGVYTKLFIPETKGKTLQEIQEMLNKKSITKKTVRDQVYVTDVPLLYCKGQNKSDA